MFQPLTGKKSLYLNIFQRQYGSIYNEKIQEKHIFSETVKSLVCQQFLHRELKHLFVDKIFAATWLGHNTICAGTKDNKLLVWDLNKQPVIPYTVALPTGMNPPLQSHCGIHFVRPNPSMSMLATGASNEAEVAIFALPSFKPITVLTGHTDWVFASDYLNEDTLVTGSRDSTISLWKIGSTSGPTTFPITSKKAHALKTRDLVCSINLQKIYSLGSEGEVKEWDATSFSEIHKYPIPDKSEVVCISYSTEKNIIAVGSQNNVTLIDPRSQQAVLEISSSNFDWGVRSLNWRDFIISSGGGAGRISFFDIRFNKYIQAGPKGFLEVTGGWLLHDAVYNTHFRGLEVPQAIYTHCFDPSGLRLFVGGGPLNLGLKGAHASLW